jgi:ATP adenylyltransferase
LIEDKYPVIEGHSLVIPRRHVVDYFGMTSGEQVAANALLQQRKEQLEQSDSSIDGFNIGMNSGSAAGQTIFHSHIHLIPRRSGDSEDPTGGVRFVIPEKANYKK